MVQDRGRVQEAFPCFKCLHNGPPYHTAGAVDRVAATFRQTGIGTLEHNAARPIFDLGQFFTERFACLCIGGLDPSTGIDDEYGRSEAIKESQEFFTHLKEKIISATLANSMADGIIRPRTGIFCGEFFPAPGAYMSHGTVLDFIGNMCSQNTFNHIGRAERKLH